MYPCIVPLFYGECLYLEDLRVSVFCCLLVQLALRRHSPHSLDGLVHRHLCHFSMFLEQFLMLLATLLHIFMSPLETVRHVQVVIGETRAVRNGVRDKRPGWLPKVDLYARISGRPVDVIRSPDSPSMGTSSCRLPSPESWGRHLCP